MDNEMGISIKVMMIPHACWRFICATSLDAVQPILDTTYVVIAASCSGNGSALKATVVGPQPKTSSLHPPP